MVPRPYIYHSVLIAALAAMYLFVLLVYPYSFNYELNIHWHNELLFFSVALYAFFLGGMMVHNRFRHLNAGQVIVFIAPAILYMAFAVYPPLFSFSNEHLCVLVSLLPAGVIMYYIQAGPARLLLWGMVLLAYLVEAGIGVWQYMADGSISGSLRNSGVYACYMTIHLPLILYFLGRSKASKYAQPIFFFFAAITLALVFVNYSRTAVIAFFVIMLLLYAPLLWKRLAAQRKPLLVALLVIVFAGAGFAGSYVFNVKRLSSWGRVMKWDIARDHAGDDVFFGTGIGRFTWYYPQWQAAYFRDTPSPPADYYMSAGESFILFNEYLQLFLESGLIGLLLFCLGMYLFFRASSAGNNLAMHVKIMGTGILACGFTSYPLHTIPLLFLLVLCYATVRAGNTNPKPAGRISLLLWPALAVSIAAGYFSFERMAAVRQWKSIKQDYSLSQSEIPALYQALYPRLADDGKFLADYAAVLMQQAGNCQRAATLLERSKRYVISADTYYATATAYKCLGKYDIAIEHYRFMSWYIPVLFRPKYEMALLYKEAGNMEAALNMAKLIVNMPVKIPSPEIDQMKAEMRQWILHSSGSTNTSYR